MHIDSVEIAYFKCFGKDVTVNFPTEGGLYLLTGMNLDTPALGANGIGKSSLFDAVCWCLYGQSSSGEKAGSLKNYKAKGGYAVVVNMTKDGTPYRIARTWNPNTTQLNNTDVKDEVIADLIGLTYEQFLFSIYFKQNPSSFIDLTPNGKLAFLSNLFQLDRWVACADKAKQKASESKSALEKLNLQQQFLTTAIASAKEKIEDYVSKGLSWTQEQEEKITAQEKQVAYIKDTFADIPTQSEADNSLVEAKELKLELEKQCAALEKELSKVGADLRFKTSQQTKLTSQLENLDDQTNTTCVTCGQPITEEHVEACAAELFTQLETVTTELDALIDKEKQTESEINALKPTLTEAKQIYEDLLVESKNLQTKIALEQQKRKSYQSALKQLDDLKAAVNPYTSFVDSETKTLEQNISKASEQEQTILQVQKQLANFEFWVKKFPLVRLTILNEVVEELEIHFNQSFSAMGLYDWSVKLSTERQLKDESTKIELTMTLLKGDQEISIASLSGGERQRIRLCVNLGISDLIKSRCGASWDIVLLDEPCASMSQEGIDHLLSLLSALSEQMIVMLAEHRVMDSARFKGIYTLVKNTDQMTDLVKG